MAVETKGCRELFTEVIETGLCALCGACTGNCPYLVHYKGRIALLDNCTLSDGQCYKYCPRTYIDMNNISQQVFGIPYSEEELGTVIEVFMARTMDARIRKVAQSGGVVTTLLSVALTERLIDNIVLTRTSDDNAPNPVLARSESEMLQCAGSNYVACPVLVTYNQIHKDDGSRLGIVGVPCQILAVAKMKATPPVNRVSIGNVKLVIGLFCTWALSPNKFHQFLKKKLDLSRVKKFDIPPPPANRFDIYTTSEKISFSLDEIRQFIMPTCAYCLDMTSEFADISVGSVEGIEGWNTVIVRTNIGAELMKAAKAERKLETDKLPSENLAHLKEAALLKKKRALKELTKKGGEEKTFLYVDLSPHLAKKLLT
jgi:coenzyme F420 hydrogenase subunit beta